MLTEWKVPISFLSAKCLPKSVAFKDWRLPVLTNVCNVLSIFVTHSLSRMLKTLQKIWKFDLISWCGNFLGKCTVSEGLFSKSPETLWRLCVSKKYPYQEISVFYSVKVYSLDSLTLLIAKSFYSWKFS